MLDWFEIRDFAIADHLELELQPGFTVLTGETGSGKSIIVDALALLLGERAHTGAIRHGCDKSEVQGSFSLPPDHPAQRWLRDQALDSGGECVLRRIVRREKPGRGFINDRAVPIATLRGLGALLVDIHGQHEHQSLLRRDTQRSLLDDQAGLGDELRRLGEIHERLTTLHERLQTLTADAGASRERAELLHFQLQELEALDPQPDEWPELEQKQRRLGRLGDLIDAARTAAQQIESDEEATISRQLVHTTQRLEPYRDYDPDIEAALQLLAEAEVRIDEAAQQLRRCYQQNELDPQEIAGIEQRFSSWFELARKHRIGPESLADLQASLQAELAELADPAAQKEALETELATAHKRYEKLAATISARRAKAAKKFSRAVTRHMQQLGMAGGKFQAVLRPVPSGEPTRYGNEQTEFLVTANPGQPLQPLTKVASGGELSRISLAIQVIAAGSTGVPTLVFDEVDVGIGGKVAHIVGDKLRALGASRQVLCVTHLAQVAARGEQHLSVSKAQERKLAVIITPLGRPRRIEEIACMAGGSELNPRSLAHAEAMLDNATADDKA